MISALPRADEIFALLQSHLLVKHLLATAAAAL